MNDETLQSNTPTEANKKSNGFENFVEKILQKPFLIISALAVIVYFQTIFFGYVLYDDQHFLLDDPGKIEKLTDIGAALSSSYMYSSYYRPIINLSFYIDTQLAGESATMHHLTNLFFHTITSCLVFLLFVKLGHRKQAGFMVGALFAVHPLFSNAVAWIVGRNDLIVAFFGLIAFISFLNYFKTGKTRSLIFHALFLLLAAFTKELALLLPLITAIYYVVYRKDADNKAKLLPLVIIWLLPVILFPAIKSQLGIPMTDPYFDLANIFKNYRVVPEMIAKMIIPVKLSTMPTFNLFSTIFGFVLIAVAIVVYIKNFRRIDSRKALFGLLWFGLLFGPGLFIRVIKAGQMQDYLDCRVYFPVIGLIILLLQLLPQKALELRNKLTFIVFAVILVVFAALNINQSRNYKDKFTFREDAARMNPEVLDDFIDLSPMVLDSLLKVAAEMDEIGDYAAAVDNYSKAVKIDSNNYRYFVNRGLAYEKLDKTSEAIDDFTKVLDLKPEYPPAFYKRATLYIREHNYAAAVKDLDKVIENQPQNVPAWYLRGSAKIDLYDYNGAIDDLSKVLEIENDHVLAYMQRGIAYMFLKDFNKALADYNKAIEYDPKSSESYLQRGVIKIELGRKASACEDFRRAKEMGSPQAETLLERHCK